MTRSCRLKGEDAFVAMFIGKHERRWSSLGARRHKGLGSFTKTLVLARDRLVLLLTIVGPPPGSSMVSDGHRVGGSSLLSSADEFLPWGCEGWLSSSMIALRMISLSEVSLETSVVRDRFGRWWQVVWLLTMDVGEELDDSGTSSGVSSSSLAESRCFRRRSSSKSWQDRLDQDIDFFSDSLSSWSSERNWRIGTVFFKSIAAGAEKCLIRGPEPGLSTGGDDDIVIVEAAMDLAMHIFSSVSLQTLRPHEEQAVDSGRPSRRSQAHLPGGFPIADRFAAYFQDAHTVLRRLLCFFLLLRRW